MTTPNLHSKVLFKSFLLIALLVLNSVNLLAQVTIGVDEEPNPGALLDLKENTNLGQNSTRGLLLPRVSLHNINSINPILNADTASSSIQSLHSGLMVFNMTDDYAAKLCRGVYVWSANIWKRLNQPCCFQLKEVVITNPSLNFNSGETAVFEAMVRNPLDLQDPNLEYEWYLDGVKVQTRNSESTFSLPMTMSHNGKQISVKVYNLCSEVMSQNYLITVSTVCQDIANVIIKNNYERADFRFASGKEVWFYADVQDEPTSPIEYRWEWTYGGQTHVYTDNYFSAVMNDVHKGSKLKLTVSNDCPSTATNEVILDVYTIQCPTESEKYNRVPDFTKFAGWNQPKYTISIKELEGYTKAELDAMDIQIQWYKKQIRYSDPQFIDDRFVPIVGANEPQLVITIADYFGGDSRDILNFGVKVTGNGVNLLDCPINNGTMYYKLISGGGTDVLGNIQNEAW